MAMDSRVCPVNNWVPLIDRGAGGANKDSCLISQSISDSGARHAAKDDEACLLFFLSNVVFLRLYRAALPDIKDGREAGVCY